MDHEDVQTKSQQKIGCKRAFYSYAAGFSISEDIGISTKAFIAIM